MYKIYAVIVTFNPEAKNINSLVKSLISQVDGICVVDNGSEKKDFIAETLLSNVFVVHVPKNVGIAKAQNLGIKHCLSLGAEYFVFFDQDSQISSDLITNLFTEFKQLSYKEKVGAVGPIFYNPIYNFIYPQVKLTHWGGRKKIVPSQEMNPFEVSFIISSGTFTSTLCLNDIGLMREDFFIDYVDTEWCLRALSLGYKFYAVPSARMSHTIGDDNINFLMWKLPVHSPWRRYFRMRNMFLLFCLSHVPVTLKIREFLINNIHQGLLVMYRSDRKAYLSYWAKAMKDGFKFYLCKNK